MKQKKLKFFFGGSNSDSDDNEGQENGSLQCKYCKSEFKNHGALATHEKFCPKKNETLSFFPMDAWERIKAQNSKFDDKVQFLQAMPM